jgi:von Willebrand factor type A domain-containing protein
MHAFKRPLIAAAVAAAALAAGAIQIGSAAAATACTPRTNVEVILDDSGSMAGFDFDRLRVAGTKLLLDKPANQKKTFGAVQFGTDATTVFAPGVVGTNATAMKAALDAQILADDGSTNYNAAFDKARLDNPNATARIFLTDGGHNAGDYLNGHQGGPRTDVIGFGSSTTGEDGLRLQAIAKDTGGNYYPQTDSSTLQSVMNEIDSIYNCQAAPTVFKDTFNAVGQTKNHSINIGGGTRSVDIVLSWVGQTNVFEITKLRLLRGKRLIAKGSSVVDSRRKRKVRKLKVTRKQGTTFLTVKVTRVKRGKLKFRLRAKQLGVPGLPVALTTQASKSRSR